MESLLSLLSLISFSWKREELQSPLSSSQSFCHWSYLIFHHHNISLLSLFTILFKRSKRAFLDVIATPYSVQFFRMGNWWYCCLCYCCCCCCCHHCLSLFCHHLLKTLQWLSLTISPPVVQSNFLDRGIAIVASFPQLLIFPLFFGNFWHNCLNTPWGESLFSSPPIDQYNVEERVFDIATTVAAIVDVSISIFQHHFCHTLKIPQGESLPSSLPVNQSNFSKWWIVAFCHLLQNSQEELLPSSQPINQSKFAKCKIVPFAAFAVTLFVSNDIWPHHFLYLLKMPQGESLPSSSTSD